MRTEMRKEVEEKCQVLLGIAANSIDTRGANPYQAYDWARGRLDGMADAFFIMNEFELYHIARYYYKIAENKIDKILG